MEWLDNLSQYNPALTKLHVRFQEITGCLMPFGAKFEDADWQFQMMELATRLAKMRQLSSLTLSLQDCYLSYIHPAPETLGHFYIFEALAMLMLPYLVKASTRAGNPHQTIEEIHFVKKTSPTKSTSNGPDEQTIISCNIPMLVQQDRDFHEAQRRELEIKSEV